MAPSPEGASSSNSSVSSNPEWKFHVFLSFSREDTRKNFTDYLYSTLQMKGIITLDDAQLENGKVTSEQLLKDIEESLSSIVVLSPKYASSTWCLDQLQKILECRKALGTDVFPVFYDIDPSDVRYQKGSFAEAFRNHEETFREDKDKVKKWREALKEVAGLSGWDSQNRHQSPLIEEIVAELWTKVQAKLPAYIDELIGIGSREEHVLSILGKGSDGVRFIGIWGMGGAGKTTLARVVYEKIRNQFEIKCFLEDVRETSGERGHGLIQLQRKLLSCLRIKGMEIKDLYDGMNTIRSHLFNKKVLLVLDDISTISQLENLAGDIEWFGSGSRVIITTRDKQLLTLHKVSEIYNIQLLNGDESLQLFRQKAFKGELEQGYLELSKNVVQYAGGLPLALKVLGSYFSGRSVFEWENALDKFKKVPSEDIVSPLRRSFEELDDTEKNIFLIIACLFKGMDKVQVTHILEICDLYPTIGINVLIDKSLLTEYYEHGKCCFGMHNMLQEMGKSIVIHESLDNAGKRSWLWLSEDIDHVLTKNKGTDVIQGIVQEAHRPYEGHWDPNAFSNMINLKLLILRSWDLPLGLTCLSEGLKYLEWEEFPLKELPLGVQLNELVELTMRHSKIKQLWLGTKNFEKLKLIDLKYSEDIKRFPTVYGVPCLERLVLEGCINLVEVHQSVGLHKKLMVLNLRNCVNLETLPSKLEMDSLKELILSGCSKVKKLPEFGKNMKFLSKLDLKDCKSILCLPESIIKLESLKILNTSGCSKLSRLPENLDKIETLEEFNFSGTAIREVPSCISHLKYLKKLSLSGHKVTKANTSSLSLPLQWMFWRRRVSTGILLPPLSSFSFLEELDLSYCDLTDELLPIDLGCLSSLRKLDISGNNFTNLPASCTANLSKLYYLKLDCCPRLKSVPVLPPHIEYLYGINCTSWKPLSDPQYLCYFFKSYQKMRSGYQPFWIFPGNEIPPWFSNQNYFQQELCSSFRQETISESDYSREWESDRMRLPGACHSMMSIIVDIPQFCLSSEWWGIAVCLVLENQFLPSPWFVPTLDWICKTPESDTPVPSASSYVCWIEEFSGSHLCILLLNGVDRNIQQHLRADQNQIQLSFHAQAIPRGSDYSSHSSLIYLNISKCGCRVLCKEDLEGWSKEWGQQQQSNNFEIHSSSLNKCRGIQQDLDDNQCCDGFEEERETTSDAELKRRKLG